MSTSLDFNSYQTPLNEVTLKVLDSVSQTELFDSLSKIKLLEILTSKTRLRAKDLPRWDYPNLPDEKDTNPGLLFRKLDPKGRIFVDISNPHILEDMQYFRPAAKHFEEFGCYTKFFENPDPNSDFMKFWNEERRRCLEGYVREYDGEWIPGYLYHYWNYGRVKVKIKTGKRTANEVVNFPHVYDSTYWFFHYIEWAESTGYFGFLLKKRRWGYSYILETMLLRNYTHIIESKGYIMASQKEYLYRDGPMPKFKSNLAFIEGSTPFISPRLIDTMEHTKAGYKDKETGIEKGRFSEVMGVTCKDDPDKGRGKCFAPGTRVMMANGDFKFIEDISIGEFVMGIDSTPRKVLETHKGVDEMFKITPMNGDVQIVNSNHDIYTAHYDYRKNKITNRLIKPKEYIDLLPTPKIGYNLEKTSIDFSPKEIGIDPYLLGLWLGDGSSAKPEITNIDEEVIEYLHEYAEEENIKCKEYIKKGTFVKTMMFSGGGEKGYHNIITNKLKNKLLALNLINNKHIPEEYLKNSRSVRLKLLAGLLDTDGSYDSKYKRFEIIQVNKLLTEQIVYLCRSLGFKTSLGVKRIKEYNKDYHRITIFNDLHLIPTRIKRKQAPIYKKQQLNSLHSKFKVESLGQGEYYGFTVDKDHLFVLGDFTITHNSGKLVAFEEVGVFPQVEKTWTVTEESVKQGDLMYGFLLAGGTGGTDNADFAGAEKMFYNPEGYNIKPLPNIYSKTNGNGICAFFVPTYLSYEEYYDKDGNSDVTGALIRLLAERQKIRQTTNDSNRLLQKKAEAPITPEEAVLRKEGSIFPILDIKEFLSSIYPQEDKFVAPHYTGNLILDGDGEVRFALNKSVTPIRHYPTKPDIDKVGCLEIFEHPQKGGDRFRYIIGVDPVENDEVLYSVSLASVFVFDRYTRRIVAEYSGRPSTTNEFFEICYRLALYYNCTIMYENNKKGMYAYFQTNKKALHLLADFPEHLKDRQTLKPATFSGNTSKGYTSNPEIKKSGKKYQADWMLEVAYSSGYGEPEFDEDGNPIIKKNELNLHKIRSIGYLEEASQWTVDGNFDRVDAMTAIMIYDIELGQFETTRAKEAVKTKLDDPFFKRTGGVNYKNKSILQKGWNY